MNLDDKKEEDTNWGEIPKFKLGAFIMAAEELLRSDEAERALNLLDNLPGFYRDHPPKEITALKNTILGRICTPSWYANTDNRHVPAYQYTMDQRKQFKAYTRGTLLYCEVKQFNEQGLVPHITDFGPGDYALPLMLDAFDLKFTYQPIALHLEMLEHVKPVLKERLTTPSKGSVPMVYVACEIIEHLWNEQDIKTEMISNNGALADVVHVSTPLYTFTRPQLDWTEIGKLEHLRTYTPMEFDVLLTKMFPEYNKQYFYEIVQHMRLTFKGSKFDLRDGIDIRSFDK